MCTFDWLDKCYATYFGTTARFLKFKKIIAALFADFYYLLLECIRTQEKIHFKSLAERQIRHKSENKYPWNELF